MCFQSIYLKPPLNWKLPFPLPVNFWSFLLQASSHEYFKVWDLRIAIIYQDEKEVYLFRIEGWNNFSSVRYLWDYYYKWSSDTKE